MVAIRRTRLGGPARHMARGTRQSSLTYGERDGDVPDYHMASRTRWSSSPNGERDEEVPARHIASGTKRSSSPYGERDVDIPVRHTSSGTRSRSSFWLSSGDLYGRGMMFVLLPVSFLVSRKSSFDNSLCNSFSDLYEDFKIGFQIIF